MSQAQPVPGLRDHGQARQPLTRRRHVLRSFAAAALLGTGAQVQATPLGTFIAGSPAPEPFPDAVTVLAAGPQAGRMDQWARVICPALARGLPPGTTWRRTAAGGADGVTAANQFDARVVPDGGTVLLVPGETPLAWLTGDPRARFDAARWLPVMAGLTPGVLVSRLPIAALRSGGKLRVAASSPAGPELSALLALDLMGIEPVPVTGANGPEAARQAVRVQAADALFVAGPDATHQLAAAATLGAAPLFTLGAPGDGGLARDPLLPQVPTASELVAGLRGHRPGGPLHAAWRAIAAAAAIEFALVLPPLTPAALLAQWRRAGAEAAAAPELQDHAPGVRLFAAPEAYATSAIAANAPALLELRRWMAIRFGSQRS